MNLAVSVYESVDDNTPAGNRGVQRSFSQLSRDLAEKYEVHMIVFNSAMPVNYFLRALHLLEVDKGQNIIDEGLSFPKKDQKPEWIDTTSSVLNDAALMARYSEKARLRSLSFSKKQILHEWFELIERSKKNN